jgi:hypothetical protein
MGGGQDELNPASVAPPPCWPEILAEWIMAEERSLRELNNPEIILKVSRRLWSARGFVPPREQKNAYSSTRDKPSPETPLGLIHIDTNW